VGKSTDQWRPCSDKYFPSMDGPPQTWPMTYIHHTGPPIAQNPSSTPFSYDDNNGHNNSTSTEVKHEQSLVDRFLSIFTSSLSDASSSSNVSSPEPVAEAAAATTVSSFAKPTLDLLPGFRVVDVTDKPQSLSRLYSYRGTSYNTNRLQTIFAKKRPFVYI